MYIITLRQTQFSYIVRMQVAKYQTLEYLISVVKKKYFFKKESIKLGKNCRSYIIKQYLLIMHTKQHSCKNCILFTLILTVLCLFIYRSSDADTKFDEAIGHLEDIIMGN